MIIGFGINMWVVGATGLGEVVGGECGEEQGSVGSTPGTTFQRLVLEKSWSKERLCVDFPGLRFPGGRGSFRCFQHFLKSNRNHTCIFLY